MKSFTFFGVLWLAFGHVRPSSQSMIDYLANNTEPQHKSCPKQISTFGATCLQLYSNYTYRCPYGFYYSSSCRLGKVFPGVVVLNIPYNESMGNTKSQNYEGLYDNLTTFFSRIFEDTFREITILNVKVKEDKNATVTDMTEVMLITGFDEEGNMTAEELEEHVNASLNDSNISSFRGKTGCDIGICDKNTTVCKEVEGGIPECECKEGLAKTNLEDKACRICDSNCSAANNKFCFIRDLVPQCRCLPNFEDKDGECKACSIGFSGEDCQDICDSNCSAANNKFCFIRDLVPQCRCLPNFEDKDGECKACSIGFSGEDCQDSYMAIIIGVSTAAGVLLVALIGVTTYFLVRKQGPKAQHQQLISNEYSTLDNPSGVSPPTNFAEDGRIFPRIKATNGTPSRRATADNPTNFYEGGAANRGYVPERDYRNENWLEMPSKY